MPIIKSSAELRNSYNEISNLCHTYNEPIYITKNGKGDLAIMSIETYEQLMGKFELYSTLLDRIEDVNEGRWQPFEEAMEEIRKSRKR